MVGWIPQFVSSLFRFGRPKPGFNESDYLVEVNDEHVSCQYPDGEKHVICWPDLQSVVIRTNDRGPFRTDIFWVLKDKSEHSECVIPLGARGEAHLLDRLQALPEFDDEAFIEAMESDRSKKFTCWRSKPSHA